MRQKKPLSDLWLMEWSLWHLPETAVARADSSFDPSSEEQMTPISESSLIRLMSATRHLQTALLPRFKTSPAA